MRAIDRYVLRQLFEATVFVTVALAAIIWLTQSLRFVELIINRGLSLGSFMYLTALLLPSFLLVILPVSLACAILFVYNKLIVDSELVVLRSAGLSQTSLAAPAVIMAGAVAVVCYSLSLFFLPASFRQFKDLEHSIRNDYSAIFLREGVFNSLGEGFTVYIRQREGSGELLGLLVHDARTPQRPVTMMAERGALVSTADGPRVLLVQGNRQEVERETGRLSLLYFDRYTLDLSQFTKKLEARWREPQERFIDELFYPPKDQNDVYYASNLRAEGHQRLVAPLYALVYGLMAAAALLSGEFNRRGQARRILAAVAAVAIAQAAQLGLYNLAGKTPFSVPLMYLNALFAGTAAACLLVRPPPRRKAAA
ncbi:MAG: LPS export ABC transporter permease LptF [Alphaproteobacteria bacterium]|nr:LPS export ABC transporter permease LptF [Alphaproteobacteria bacterium]